MTNCWMRSFYQSCCAKARLAIPFETSSPRTYGAILGCLSSGMKNFKVCHYIHCDRDRNCSDADVIDAIARRFSRSLISWHASDSCAIETITPWVTNYVVC